MKRDLKRMQKIKARERGQTGEGKGAMAVRFFRCYAVTDAPNASVVLCSRRGGREVRVVDGGQEVEEKGGGGGR